MGHSAYMEIMLSFNVSLKAKLMLNARVLHAAGNDVVRCDLSFEGLT